MRSLGVALAALPGLLMASAGAEALDIRPHEAPDACDPARPQLQVTVGPLDASGGILVVDLYENDPDDFLQKDGRLRRIRIPAPQGLATVCMDVKPGIYAASSYHDRDADRDLDKRWNMMPKEPFGLSNDPEIEFGWPPIGPSLFRVPLEGGKLKITLREA